MCPYGTVLLFAKSETVAAALVEQFRRHRVHHYFVALSDRKPSERSGEVSGELKKGRKGSYKITKGKIVGDPKPDGGGGGDGGSGNASATTRFFSQRVDGATRREQRLHLIVMKPVTPKKAHQLRVTCKTLGAPVLGDVMYAGAKAKVWWVRGKGWGWCGHLPSPN